MVLINKKKFFLISSIITLQFLAAASSLSLCGKTIDLTSTQSESTSTTKLFRLFKYPFTCVPSLLNRFISQKKYCWDENIYPLYDNKYPEIRFTEHAPNKCDLPGYPVIYIKDNGATNWIQIVDINVTPPKNQFSLRTDRWIFVDTTNEHREKNEPFYSIITPYKIFWDNPGWSCFINPFKTKNLIWQATTFSVSVKDKVITPRFAFSWGYKIDYRNILISAVKPQRIDLSVWEKFRPYFTEQYPQWIFKKISKEQ